MKIRPEKNLIFTQFLNVVFYVYLFCLFACLLLGVLLGVFVYSLVSSPVYIFPLNLQIWSSSW